MMGKRWELKAMEERPIFFEFSETIMNDFLESILGKKFVHILL
jgi:hypothetical protein